MSNLAFRATLTMPRLQLARGIFAEQGQQTSGKTRWNFIPEPRFRLASHRIAGKHVTVTEVRFQKSDYSHEHPSVN